MNQTKYIGDLLEHYDMSSCNPTFIPMSPTTLDDNQLPNDWNNPKIPFRELVGSLQYLVSCTRPDIAVAVRYLSSKVHDFNIVHWDMALRLLRYLKATINFGLVYNGKSLPGNLDTYTDATYATEPDCKSVIGYYSIFGGAAVSWKSTKTETTPSIVH